MKKGIIWGGNASLYPSRSTRAEKAARLVEATNHVEATKYSCVTLDAMVLLKLRLKL
jgi:hypothetical protein